MPKNFWMNFRLKVCVAKMSQNFKIDLESLLFQPFTFPSQFILTSHISASNSNFEVQRNRKTHLTCMAPFFYIFSSLTISFYEVFGTLGLESCANSQVWIYLCSSYQHPLLAFFPLYISGFFIKKIRYSQVCGLMSTTLIQLINVYVFMTLLDDFYYSVVQLKIMDDYISGGSLF